jgi:hypothetical protein
MLYMCIIYGGWKNVGLWFHIYIKGLGLVGGANGWCVVFKMVWGVGGWCVVCIKKGVENGVVMVCERTNG